MTPWTYEETVIAFWAYTRIPFKESSSRNPEVIRIAKIIGRSPAALNMKIGNIGRLDPSLAERGITGLTHGAKTEENVWRDFAHNPERLAFECQRLIAQLTGKSIEESTGLDIARLPVGSEREVTIKQRIGQDFFRTAVLTAYNNHCCISGVGSKAVLEACHIADWSEDAEQRTNPCNGLCMNPFFHRAYDRFLIGISPDCKITVSSQLIDETRQTDFRQYLLSLNARTITLPERFLPNRDRLAEHYEKYAKEL